MALADHFPATRWLWRHSTSRTGRLIFLSLGSALLLITLALRTHAAIFEHRVTSIVEGLAQLRLDETNKSDLLKLMPALRPCQPGDTLRPGDSCYEVELSETPDSRLMDRGRNLFKIAYWLGLRYWDFSASVTLRQDKVHKLGYHLRLTNGTLGYPGIISVAAASVRGYGAGYLGPTKDESPDYRVTRYFKWPALGIQVNFTPAVPTNLLNHAFDIRLNCIWYLRGCRIADEVLPLAAEDYRNIERSAFVRLRGPTPCPDSILARRARDVENILLVEVEKVRPVLEKFGEEQYQMADYKLLEILKGKLDRPLENVGHPFTILLSSDMPQIPNPALNLLHPGSQLLMFSDSSTNVDSPCETVAATESAKKAIQLALKSSSVNAAVNDLGR
jgi:hypothetical protein